MRKLLTVFALAVALAHLAHASHGNWRHIAEVSAVPDLSDETLTYQFESNSNGAIIFGGSCVGADSQFASVGTNTITWTLSDEVYSDCSVTVSRFGQVSNALNVPEFEVTSKYSVVLVHGLFGSGTSVWVDGGAIPTLITNGWHTELLYAGDIQTNNALPVWGTFSAQSSEVETWISTVLQAKGRARRIDGCTRWPAWNQQLTEREGERSAHRMSGANHTPPQRRQNSGI